MQPNKQDKDSHRNKSLMLEPEGYIIPNVTADGRRCCGCEHSEELYLTEYHQKGSQIDSRKVRNLIEKYRDD